MPRIPLIQQSSQLGPMPGAVLDRNRRPRVNLGGVIQAAGNLGAASQMPLDRTDITAPLRALGAAGDAVMRTGTVINALQMKRQEATDRRLINQAQSAMDQAALEFRAWQEANPNAPESWVDEARKRSESIIQPFLSMKELSGAAKSDLQLMGKSWQERFVGGVNVESAKATFGLAKQSYVQRAQSAFDAGDLRGGQTALDEAATLGYLAPVERDGMLAKGQEFIKQRQREQAETRADTFILRGQPEQARQVLNDNADAFEPVELENKIATVEERAMKSKHYNDLLVMANDDPRSAASLAIEDERRGKIDATQRVDIERRAQSVMAGNRRERVMEYTERIETPGMMPTEAEITMDGNLTDYDREQLRRRIKGASFDQATEFMDALSKVMAFSPSAFESEADAITAATNIEASIDATFSGPYAARLKEELSKRQTPTLAGATSATDIGPAMATLSEAIHEGGLGALERPVMKDGLPVMREASDKPKGYIETPGWLWGTNRTELFENDGKPVPVTEPDPVAKAKAMAVQKEIMETLQVEVKAGKLKDQAAITARALDLFKLRGGKIKPRPVTGPSPVQMDTLPDGTSPTPASGPNPLLPDIDATLNQYGY